MAEVESDGTDRPISPSSPQIEALRNTLRELAAHADATQLSELADLNLTSPTEDTVSSQDLCFSGTTVDTSISSRSSSGSSDHFFSSPLGFLQAALPDVHISVLKKALKEAEKGGREVDMWDTVGSILSAESIRELEERGLDALDEEDGVFREEDIQWEVVSPKTRKTHRPTASNKQKHSRATKITLIDVRQQNHAQLAKSASTTKTPLPDPWIQVSSIATHIATYLAPHPPSFFSSYLHSPNYETPYHALCAALEYLSESDISRSPDEDSAMLFNLLDILFPQYEPLDSEQRSRLVHETELCIRATNGRGDDVLDIVKLLRELDSDASSGKWELGIYHLPPQKPPPPPIITAGSYSKRSSQTPVSPGTKIRPQLLSPTSPSARMPHDAKLDPYQWQTVPIRHIPDNSPHPLAQNIPAYAHITASGHKLRGSGNGFGKGGKGDVGELSSFQGRIREHRRKQEEYLRQAAKMWQRGDKKSRGGEIAFYYAEKVGHVIILLVKLFVDRLREAREFQELAKQEALENARIMVHAKRFGGAPFMCTHDLLRVLSLLCVGLRLENMMRLISTGRQCLRR